MHGVLGLVPDGADCKTLLRAADSLAVVAGYFPTHDERLSLPVETLSTCIDHGYLSFGCHHSQIGTCLYVVQRTDDHVELRKEGNIKLLIVNAEY